MSKNVLLLMLALSWTACGESTPDPDASATDGGRPPNDATVDPIDASGDASRDASSPFDAGPVVPIDPLESPSVMRVDDGFQFTEGPQWVAERGVLLFSDIPARMIHELTPPSTIAPYDPTSGGSNGLAIDGEGRVLRAEHGGRRIARERIGEDAWETLADRFEGNLLNSPNDLVVARDGTIYFTDPPYGLEGRPSELDFMGVFRLEPGGALTAEDRLARERRPNGIVLSPDESILYVADGARDAILSYPVLADGALGDALDETIEVRSPDGMAIDEAGNLYVASADGIVVLAPDGTEWGRIAIPEQPANCAFGGADRRTLYVTARTGLYTVTGLAIAGVL